MFTYYPLSHLYIFFFNYHQFEYYTRSPYDEHNINEEEKFHLIQKIIFYFIKIQIHQLQLLQYIPTIDIIDPMQGQYFYQTSSTNLNDTQNQLNKFRILCNAKDKKVNQLENLYEEFREKYESDTRTLKHKLELNESNKENICFLKTQKKLKKTFVYFHERIKI